MALRRSDAALSNNFTVPIVRAAIELNRNNPSRAIEILRPTLPFELASDYAGRGLMPIYLRGQAYLKIRDANGAEREFQKIADHRGVDPLSPLHPLARLGLARAYAMERDLARSRSEYQDFFYLWKDADPDLLVLREAKAEYAGLQSQEQ